MKKYTWTMEFAWFIWEKGKQRSEIVWAEWNGKVI